MPKGKDLKRLVRARMEKTGEAYSAARLQLLNKKTKDLAELAGVSDASVKKATGRGWGEWVRVLDAENAREKAHREIARYVSSLGVPSWWSQTVTVGYERIRGLRARGQRRDGGYEASKSKTFAVPLERLYKAFADARMRRKWLDVKISVKRATPEKRMRIAWPDGTSVQLGFFAKGASKSMVSVQHEKLADKASADAIKGEWGKYLEKLGETLT